MLQLKGQVLIQVKDSLTEQVKREVCSENLITNVTLLNFIQHRNVYGPAHNPSAFHGRRISISTSAAVPQRTVATVPNVIGTGYVPPDITSPKYSLQAEIPYIEIQNRIEQVGFQRTFRTVALTTLGSNSVNDKLQNNLTATGVAAYLLLTVPCIQEADEILDIFYRIQFLNTLGQNINNNYDFIREFAAATFEGSGANFPSPVLGATAVSIPPSNLGYTRPYFPSNPAAIVLNGASSWNVYQRIDSHFKLHAKRDFTLAEQVGRIFNGILQMRSPNLECAFSWRAFEHKSYLQGFFSHSSSSNRPFLDVTALAHGTGKVRTSLPNNTWITPDKWPECTFIRITQTGDVSTAAYRVQIARTVGYVGNTYQFAYVANPYRNTKTAAFPGAIGFNTNKLLAVDNVRFLQYGDDGINIINARTGDYRIYNATSTPALPVTKIGQVAVKNELVYVACRQNGLFLINLNTNTVQRISNVPCYGVDIGKTVTYAVFEGRISNSINWNSPLNFNFTGISNNNWGNVAFIKVDPSDEEGRMAIVTNSPNRIVWYNPSNSVVSIGPNTPFVGSDSMLLDVTDVGGFWLFSDGYLVFDGVSRTTFGTNSSVSYGGILSVSGRVGRFPIVITDGDKFFKTSGLFKASDNTLVQSFDQSLADYDCDKGFTYLNNGVFLVGGYIGVIKYNPHYLRDYGWTGSQWVLNFNADKPLHTGFQPLPNGVHIKFENGNLEPSFVAGDYYTQFVCEGFWKDNASTFSYVFDFYSKPTVTNAPISVRLLNDDVFFPASPGGSNPDPNFLRIETHQVGGYKLFLNNNPVTTIYVNNEVPGPGEITIDGATGRIRYNPANEGMLLTGTYVYIRD